MAKIQLVIDAEDAHDLKTILADLAGLQPEVYVLDTDHPKTEPTQDAELGEHQRRPRRTKAQIAADEAAKNASAAGTAGGTSATGSATTGDPFGDQVHELAKEPTADGVPTHEELKSVLAGVLEKAPTSAPKLQALFMEHGGGAKSASQVAPEHRAAVIKALQEFGRVDA